MNFYWKVKNHLQCFYLFVCLMVSHVGFDLLVGPLGFNYTKAFSFKTRSLVYPEEKPTVTILELLVK